MKLRDIVKTPGQLHGAHSGFSVTESGYVFSPFGYCVGFDDVKTSDDILLWVHHISEKSWIKPSAIGAFVMAASRRIGKPIYKTPPMERA